MLSLKNSYKPGFVLALLGLGIAAVPYVFPVCQGLLKLADGRSVPMRCFWTGRASMILGVLLVAAGLLIAFASSVEGRRMVSWLASLIALAVILTPLYIIPTCANPEMSCNIASKPAWILLGGAAVLFSLWTGRAQKSEMTAFESA